VSQRSRNGSRFAAGGCPDELPIRDRELDHVRAEIDHESAGCRCSSEGGDLDDWDSVERAGQLGFSTIRGASRF
jgi:hypothetical protein